jgi:hypothetical protein
MSKIKKELVARIRLSASNIEKEDPTAVHAPEDSNGLAPQM